ncbi:MAG: hypothetical protein AB8C13_03485 [Phycisphaerales bacterium]
MSSINTSNSLNTLNAIAAGKAPTDPARHPLQRTPGSGTQSRTPNDDATGVNPKARTEPYQALRATENHPNHPANKSGVRDDSGLAAAPIPQAVNRASALDTAQKLIATTLIKPILAQARASNNAPPPFNQTQAEKQFGALLDNKIADDISKASSFPIAQRIADKIIAGSPVSAVETLDQQPKALPQPSVDIFG